jgi:mono/diheme cytochrome c family protein
MYDPRFNFDGKNMPVVIPPALGLRDVAKEIYTGDDTISYWNLYVGVTQMHGHGTFVDPRINASVHNPPENLGTAKLAALRAYQFSLPKPMATDLDAAAAERGRVVFNGAGTCSSCHTGVAFTDVNSGKLHSPSEVGQSAAYAERSATKMYRTTPLRGLHHPPQLDGPYFHDGSAKTLADVVDHYVTTRHLTLTPQQKSDLVEYLKSL